MSEILCHCAGADTSGHQPGADGCAEKPIKHGRYQRAPHPTIGDNAAWPCPRFGELDARGTCPTCGKTRVKVTRIETYGHVPGGPGRVLLHVAPGIAPHRGPDRQPCPGTGRVSAETRYTPGRELATWTEVNGAESVAS